MEVPAPSNGVLESISVNEGETVNVGATLGSINGQSKSVKEDFKEVKTYSPPQKKNEVKKKSEPLQLLNEEIALHQPNLPKKEKKD